MEMKKENSKKRKRSLGESENGKRKSQKLKKNDDASTNFSRMEKKKKKKKEQSWKSEVFRCLKNSGTKLSFDQVWKKIKKRLEKERFVSKSKYPKTVLSMEIKRLVSNKLIREENIESERYFSIYSGKVEEGKGLNPIVVDEENDSIEEMSVDGDEEYDPNQNDEEGDDTEEEELEEEVLESPKIPRIVDPSEYDNFGGKSDIDETSKKEDGNGITLEVSVENDHFLSLPNYSQFVHLIDQKTLLSLDRISQNVRNQILEEKGSTTEICGKLKNKMEEKKLENLNLDNEKKKNKFIIHSLSGLVSQLEDGLELDDSFDDLLDSL